MHSNSSLPAIKPAFWPLPHSCIGFNYFRIHRGKRCDWRFCFLFWEQIQSAYNTDLLWVSPPCTAKWMIQTSWKCWRRTDVRSLPARMVKNNFVEEMIFELILKGQFICAGRKVQGGFRDELTGGAWWVSGWVPGETRNGQPQGV